MVAVDRSGWIKSEDFPRFAEGARAYTKSALSLGPANQGFHPVSGAQIAYQRLWLTDDKKASGNSESGVNEAREVKNYAEKLQTGNCTEHASVAFMWLYDRGIKPIFLLGYDCRTMGLVGSNHMFVAVGLDQSVGNFTMGLTADHPHAGRDKSWICDPWRDITYKAIDKFWAMEPKAASILQIQAFSV